MPPNSYSYPGTRPGYSKPEEEEEKKPSKKQAGWGGFLAMLPTIAGTIPGLLQSRQTGALKRMQRGLGAGAVSARQTGSEAARRVLGASTAQPSSGRGGNLREGIRAADKLTQRGSQAAGLIGAREGALATGQLLAEEQRRRGLGQQLGAGLGGAGASLLAMMMAARDQGPDRNAKKDDLSVEAPEAPTAKDLAAGMVMDAPSQIETGAQQAFIQGAQNQLQGFQQKRMQAMPPAPQGPPTAGSTTMEQSLAPQGQAESALPAMVGASPAQKMEQATKDYTRNVTKPSERPFSKGGSDLMAIQQQEVQALQAWVMRQVELGVIKPEDAPRILQEMTQAMQGSQ